MTRLWEIYDAALSPQGGGKYVAGQRMYTQRNLSFHHNIVGHAEYCFEIWSQGNTSACAMQHVRFDNNLCLDSVRLTSTCSLDTHFLIQV
jgi:hypothetical protein